MTTFNRTIRPYNRIVLQFPRGDALPACVSRAGRAGEATGRIFFGQGPDGLRLERAGRHANMIPDAAAAGAGNETGRTSIP